MVNKLKTLLETSENIGIAVGRDPGIDEMAGALSLYLALGSEGKKVTIASPTDPLVEVSSLVGIDRVKKGFDAEQGDLTVSFPYKEGEIEKISYTLEDGKLNILVKAGTQGLSFDENNIEYKRGAGAPKLVFVVGTPRLSDLGRVFSVFFIISCIIRVWTKIMILQLQNRSRKRRRRKKIRQNRKKVRLKKFLR